VKLANSILFILIATALFGVERQVNVEISEFIALPDSFIIEDSETLFCNGDVLSSDSYSIDYTFGSISLDIQPNCDSLLIKYSYADINIPLTLQNKIPTGSGGQLFRSPSPTKNLGMFPEGNRLVHSGSLLRGIKIGSRRDASVESAFQLEAYGEVGENVEITAILSDQDLPIQPEGTSEKIAQLDQVFIDITAPHFGGTFGDFTAEISPQSEFSKYERRLSGVRIAGNSEFISAEGVGAVLEGIWATDEFYGNEGNQGPYSITADNKTSIQILAGTETVWLDGKKLRRGSSNDYIIDYNLGQITFTNNQPIGAQSRIIVDFQYTDLDYRRSFYGIDGEMNPHENVRFYFSGMAELDDSESPLNFELSDEERAIIESAGDNADDSYIWGASISDTGDYVFVDSTSDSAHFEWVGEGVGTWNVIFSNVGSGNGDYVYSGNGIYEWVGVGNGSYLPLKYLPLPAAHSIIDAGLVFTPLDGMTLSTEVAASNLDLNRLSDIDNNDNVGGALLVNWKSKNEIRSSGKDFGVVSFDGIFRKKETRFVAIGRMDDAEYFRDWGLSEARGEEQLTDLTLSYLPFDAMSITAGYGQNKIGSQTSKRANYAVKLTLENTNASINQSRTMADYTWDRLWGDFSGKYWVLAPYFDWRYEDNAKPSGIRFLKLAPSLRFSISENISITPSYEYREDELYNSDGIVRQVSSVTNAYKISSAVGGWNLSVYHREYDDRLGVNDVTTDLASANGSFRTVTPLINGRIRYELSRNRSEVLEPYYLFVGEGLGNYEFDESRGEYIISPGGEYLKEYRSTGEFTPVIRSDVRINLSAKPGKIKSESLLAQTIKQLSADGLLQAEGQTSAEATQSLILDPRDMNDNLNLVSGNFIAEGSLRYGIGAKSLNFRRRFSKYRNIQYTTGEELRWTNSYAFEGRFSSLSLGNFRVKYEWSWRARLYPESSRIGSDLEGSEVSLIWTKSLTNALQITTDMSFLAQTDTWPEDPVSIKRYAFSPIGSYYLPKGAIRASVGYSRVESEETVASVLPYDMANGDYIGDNGRANIDIDINVAKATLLTLTYSLKSHSGRVPEHIAQASVRVNF